MFYLSVNEHCWKYTPQDGWFRGVTHRLKKRVLDFDTVSRGQRIKQCVDVVGSLAAQHTTLGNMRPGIATRRGVRFRFVCVRCRFSLIVLLSAAGGSNHVLSKCRITIHKLAKYVDHKFFISYRFFCTLVHLLLFKHLLFIRLSIVICHK